MVDSVARQAGIRSLSKQWAPARAPARRLARRRPQARSGPSAGRIPNLFPIRWRLGRRVRWGNWADLSSSPPSRTSAPWTRSCEKWTLGSVNRGDRTRTTLGAARRPEGRICRWTSADENRTKRTQDFRAESRALTSPDGRCKYLEYRVFRGATSHGKSANSATMPGARNEAGTKPERSLNTASNEQ